MISMTKRLILANTFIISLYAAPEKKIPVLELTKANIDSQLVEKVSKMFPTVICFAATRCQLCQNMNPVILDVAQEMQQECLFFKANIDTLTDYAKKYEITSVPTFVVIRNNKVIDKFSGFHKKEQFKSKLREIFNPSDISKFDKKELSTRLQTALTSGLAQDVQKLIHAGVDVNAALDFNLSPLSFLLQIFALSPEGSVKLQLLLDAGADLTDKIGERKQTVIEFMRDQLKVARSLADNIVHAISILEKEMEKQKIA